MAVQPFIRKGTRSNATAHRLILASQTPTQRAIDQTIEFLNEDRAIFSKVGRFGITVYVQSTISNVRFLPVLINNTGCHCTCGDVDCIHAKKALRHLKESEVA